MLAGAHELVIGVPLPAVHSSYFEVFSLEELAGTLRDLAYALIAAALVTTLAGAALGRWASSRALRPLADITEAAVSVAGGELGTRVDAGIWARSVIAIQCLTVFVRGAIASISGKNVRSKHSATSSAWSAM